MKTTGPHRAFVYVDKEHWHLRITPLDTQTDNNSDEPRGTPSTRPRSSSLAGPTPDTALGNSWFAGQLARDTQQNRDTTRQICAELQDLERDATWLPVPLTF